MRAFVTGGHGFVGHWLSTHLEQAGDEVVAPGADVDVTDPLSLEAAMADARPDAVYHLAALTHVGRSWDEASDFLRVNAGGTLNVLEAARRCRPAPRVLVVSSAEVYGAVRPEDVPVDESAPLRPVSPYAASKAAAELLALQAHLGRGLAVVRARAFNHAGPGQGHSFVVPALARRIVTAVVAGRSVVPVGNLSPRRDVTDVRDVVRAYRLLIERGQPGEVYNVCSGRDVAVAELARRLLALAGADLALEPDPELARPVDTPVLVGDATRLRKATGWEPAVPLDETLAAVLDQARMDLGVTPGERS